MSDSQVLGAPKVIPEIETNPMKAAHARLLEVIEQIGPAYSIHPFCIEAQDLEERAEHVDAMFEAFRDYVRTVVSDTAENTPLDLVGRIDPKYCDDVLSDVGSDVAGAIAFAAAHMEG